MASEKIDPGTKSEKDHTSNPAFYLSSSDHPGTPLIASVLKGPNYRTWARAMKTALRAKMKLGFIDGTIKKPTIGSKDFPNWEKTDSMVVTPSTPTYIYSNSLLVVSPSCHQSLKELFHK
uniref:Retrotransposon Copia-like N-terminal domain-containing protein n=1 Tax=Cajanus cajan TaxID=3821 RepID=A0A151R134_CAJCA|nr:hypothetical protein KK1_042674 [Cajanus cajan]